MHVFEWLIFAFLADMNECALGNGGCDHQCVNTGGSFMCRCRPGYDLQPDKFSCRSEGEG